MQAVLLTIALCFRFPLSLEVECVSTMLLPLLEKPIKRTVRKSYMSMASAIVNSPSTSQSVMNNVASKIKKEMKDMSYCSHDSTLRDTVEAVKCSTGKGLHWSSTRKYPR